LAAFERENMLKKMTPEQREKFLEKERKEKEEKERKEREAQEAIKKAEDEKRAKEVCLFISHFCFNSFIPMFINVFFRLVLNFH
jgi:hypothetical protein